MAKLSLAVVAITALSIASLNAKPLSGGSGGTNASVVCPLIGCVPLDPPQPQCGTNNVTYDSPCELKVAGMCTFQPRVELAYEGPCSKDGKRNATEPPTTSVPGRVPSVSPPSNDSSPPNVDGPSPAPSTSAADTLTAIGSVFATAVITYVV